MNISLDFDGTFTEDPEFWEEWCGLAYNSGHSVYMVTLRAAKDSHASMQYLLEKGLIKRVVFCDGRSKAEVCREHNIYINVWIDDQPMCIENGSSLSLQEVEHWRKKGFLIEPI